MAAVAVPNMPIRKYRRDSSEVSSCLKYMIFGFNVLFWWLGLGILTIGVWAWTEKDIFNNISKVANIALDPAFILMCIGTLTFVIGFTGCVGALRENTCLLGTYALFLAILLLFEMTAGIMGFIFKDWIKSQATIGFQTFIIHYREDPDQQNLIDWIQEDWLQCCGIEGPKDWDRNNYFNCSSHDVGSREACGVPFSCCKRKPNELIKNKQCGYDVRKPGFPGERHIYERGCLRAGEEWIESNLVPVAAVTVSVMVLKEFASPRISAPTFSPRNPNGIDIQGLPLQFSTIFCIALRGNPTELNLCNFIFLIFFLKINNIVLKKQTLKTVLINTTRIKNLIEKKN